MPEIKERPILFSGPMVRAIIDGRKTVTRRALKVQPVLKGKFWELGGAAWSVGCQSIRPVTGHSLATRCPYGMPGDRLWVRETWQGPLVSSEEQEADPSWFKDMKRYQDPAHCAYRASGDDCEYVDPDGNFRCNWRPSIHMPRWASRILLEVTDVRVERLQDITEEQAQAEGCFFTDYGRDCFHNGGRIGDVGECQAPESSHPRRNGWMWDKTNSHEECLLTARFAFASLWQKTGGDWDANPWVWCIEFKRIQP